MSALVDIWMSELAKLGRRRPWDVTSRKRESSSNRATVEREDVQVKAEAEVAREEQRSGRRSCLSEATVCMLMDRFAPC